MSNLEKSLFQLKFTAKQLARQAKKASKDETAEKTKLKKAIKQGNMEGARIYAANAIRKKNESLNLLRLSSRIDAVSSRVQTAVTMQKVTGSMASVVKGMDKAMESMNLEKAHLDVQTQYMEGAMGNTTTMSTPQEEVDLLMQQVADESGLELNHELETAAPSSVISVADKESNEDQQLSERLRILDGLAGLTLFLRPDLFVPELALTSVIDKPAVYVAYKYSGAVWVALGYNQILTPNKNDSVFVRNTLYSRVVAVILCGMLKYMYDQMPMRILAFSAVDLGLSIMNYIASNGSEKRHIRRD
ncbi:3062_t:CDS:10 [Diversispora eburnea]|uniref:3062_t:CDS:1 n=1 Tax=Diversispora eburnea TaxID=1213867 RepID=A0A9N8V593_9GLOM|nr:3062_t:CDS:10 [Diversispora eburnea]